MCSSIRYRVRERRVSDAPDKLEEMTQTIASQIKSIDDLRGPAGRLEALLNTGRDDAPYAALVCHPHPHGGGTMHNKVVYHAMKAFSSFGLPVLRFNFRSVGLSEGAHDEGYGEQEDVQAALELDGTEFQSADSVCGIFFRLECRVARVLRRSAGEGADRARSAGACGRPGLHATGFCRSARRRSSLSAAITISMGRVR